MLTPDFVYVMGGEDSGSFDTYKNLCCRAFLTLRRHADLIINLFSMVCKNVHTDIYWGVVGGLDFKLKMNGCSMLVTEVHVRPIEYYLCNNNRPSLPNHGSNLDFQKLDENLSCLTLTVITCSKSVASEVSMQSRNFGSRKKSSLL